MHDEQPPVTADDLRAVIQPVKSVLARLPATGPGAWNAEQAEKHLDALRDNAMRSIESAAAPAKTSAIVDPFAPHF